MFDHCYNHIRIDDGGTLIKLDVCAAQMTRDAQKMNLDLNYRLLNENNFEITH